MSSQLAAQIEALPFEYAPKASMVDPVRAKQAFTQAFSLEPQVAATDTATSAGSLTNTAMLGAAGGAAGAMLLLAVGGGLFWRRSSKKKAQVGQAALESR